MEGSPARMDRRRFVTAAGATAADTLALTNPAIVWPVSPAVLPEARRRDVHDTRHPWFRLTEATLDGFACGLPAPEQRRR